MSELTAVERLALKLRHEAAVVVLRSDPDVPAYEMLAAVVSPSDEVREASERRAHELLAERAAAA